jgi:large subunit ribosomal protein L15e
MGMYKYVQKLWKDPKTNAPEIWRERLIKWRKEPSTIKLEKPTRIDKARSLGYKAKQGYVIVRQRVPKGGRLRLKIRKGRRPKHFRRRKILAKNYQQIAEERANKKYPNCEVLNSYWVMKDGKHYWYEVILIDTAHPVIKADAHINWITRQKGRINRGLTSAARKSRGLRNKGKGAEKIRPSLRANERRGTN